MTDFKLLVKKEQPEATLPYYATNESSGLDLSCLYDITIKPLSRELVPTGLRLVLPKGTEAQIRPRSGLALKKGITVLNTPGTIDRDYHGLISVILFNTSSEFVHLSAGERIAQLVVCPVIKVEVEEVNEIDVTATLRGGGGFGSTGN